MKKSLIIFVTTLLAISIDANSQDLIQGKWKVDVTNTIDGIYGSFKSNYDSLSQEIKELISNELSTREIMFGADSSYQLTTDYGTIEGTWSLEGDYIKIIDEQGGELSHRVVSSSNDHLVIEIISNPNSEALFHKLYLNLIER